MRWWFGLVVALTACQDHTGTYLIVDGGSAIAFDHVEFYFGTSLDGGFGTPRSPDQSTGQAFARDAAPSDLAVPVGSSETQTTYYLPPGTAHDLGDYMLVVAYAGTQPVGVAEALDAPITGEGSIEKIVLQLEAYDPTAVELWGQAPGCAAWTRTRDNAVSTIGVVRDNDRDCDDRIADADCDDLTYCPAADLACEPHVQCPSAGGVGSPVACMIGCTSPANVCTSATCVPSALCSPCQSEFPDFPSQFHCALPPIHMFTDIYYDDSTMAPCVTELQFTAPNNTPCADANIEFYEPRPDGYTYKVSDDGTTCTFDLVPPMPGAKYTGDYHVLISIAPATAGAPRRTFVIAVDATMPTSACGNRPVPTWMDTDSQIFDCNQ